MEFQQFITKFSSAELQLYGEFSHKKMIPIERNNLLKNSNLEIPKQAAVSMLFYPKDEQTFFVLILRTAIGVHSSQVAFPGGKFEKEDKDLSQTARRETEEEIGVSENKIKVIKEFSKVFIPVSNFEVTPFLCVSEQPLEFNLQESEVREVFEIPIEMLLSSNNMGTQVLDTSYGKSIEVPVFDFNGLKIWGATAMMLSELKDSLADVFKI